MTPISIVRRRWHEHRLHETQSCGGKITTICATLVFILSIIVLIAPSDSSDASMTVGTTKDVQWISESEQTLYDTSGTAIAEIRIVHDDEGTQRIDVRNAVDWWDQLMMRIVNQPHDPNTTYGYFGQSPSYYEYNFYTTWGMQPQPTSETIMYQFYMSDDSPTEPASDSQIVTFEFIVGEKPVYNYTTSVSYDIGEYATGDFGPDSVSESLFEQSTKILEFTVPLDVPQRTDGWVFDYWQGSDGLTYEPGAKIRATIGDDLVLTAKWIRPMVTVTFWNGDEVYIDMSVETGTTVTSPDDPRVDGMFFTGWYTDDGTFQDLFDFDTIIETDMDLYAGWEDELHFTTEPAAAGTAAAANFRGKGGRDPQPLSVRGQRTTARGVHGISAEQRNSGADGARRRHSHAHAETSSHRGELQLADPGKQLELPLGNRNSLRPRQRAAAGHAPGRAAFAGGDRSDTPATRNHR